MDRNTSDVDVVATTRAGASDRTTIGINLNGIADWSPQWPFVDVFKTSREWLSQREGAGWEEGGSLKLRPDGWVASLQPSQFAETIMMTGNHFPTGKYTLLYEGDGKIAFRYENAKIVSQSPGKMIVEVTPDDAGIFLQIRETNPNNPIRNIRFIMPGFENTYQTQPFHPIFLERLSKFKAIRFMDWMATNDSNVANWSDRSTPNSRTQSGENGVALEHMIQLANQLKIEPWFTLPAKASDDYVRRFATLVRDRLDPSLKVHIEYSNEVWNSQFSQAHYAAEKGTALGLDSNSYTASLRYYSQRSVEIFKIWESVFGSSSKSRLVKVLAGQAENPWTAEEILSWKDAYKQADVYAIAPYFDGHQDTDKDGASDLDDPDHIDAALKMTPDQIVADLMADIPNEVKTMVEKNANVATKQFGLNMVAYEGGPHLTSHKFGDKEPQVTKLYTEVNRHPGMRQVYKAYLDQWKASGGKLFNQFNDVYPPSKWGNWGALEYQNQDINTAPKYLGLMDFINANPSR
ncbi:MAG: hypothetical protein HC866_03860 [Leptolyngbyaceae cyanobacterium RU_5_1]|nr:hypothetical protein [Leptolyngbyaceae cyanobacterium RU_5_1]